MQVGASSDTGPEDGTAPRKLKTHEPTGVEVSTHHSTLEFIDLERIQVGAASEIKKVEMIDEVVS